MLDLEFSKTQTWVKGLYSSNKMIITSILHFPCELDHKESYQLETWSVEVC